MSYYRNDVIPSKSEELELKNKMANKIAIGMVLDEIPSILLSEFSKIFDDTIFFRNQWLEGETKGQTTLSGLKRPFVDQTEASKEEPNK